MTTHVLFLPLFIFVARIVDVSLGTMRMICVLRDRKWLAVGLGFIEIMVWLFAVSSVLTQLDNWLNMIAYAGGFAVGNAAGMWLEGRVALGTSAINFISQGQESVVAHHLRKANFCATTYTAQGLNGVVSVCQAIVPRKCKSYVLLLAKEVDPDVMVTVEDIRESSPIQTPAFPYGSGKISVPVRATMIRKWNTVLRSLIPMNTRLPSKE